jgi:hypothetical protein
VSCTMDLPGFVALLSALTSSDNTARAEAEARYESAKAASSTDLLAYLISALNELSTPSPIRTLSLVLLRREVVKEGQAYSALPSAAQKQFKMALLSALDIEPDFRLKGKLCDFLGELHYVGVVGEDEDEEDVWQELLVYIASCLQSTDPLKKETGLALLGTLPRKSMEVIFSEQNFASVCEILRTCLLDESNGGRLMLQAMRSLNSIFASTSGNSELDNFESLVLPIFQGLETTITGIHAGRIQPQGDYPTFGSIALDEAYAQILVELAGFNSSFFATRLQTFFEPLITLLERPSLKKEVRSSLVEFLVTICEGSPKFIRKYRNSKGAKGYFMERVLPVCINMFLTCERTSIETWASDEYDDDDDVDESGISENAISRICMSLGWLSTCTTVSSQVVHLSAMLRCIYVI